MKKLFSISSQSRPTTINMLYGNATKGRRYLTANGKLFKESLGLELLGKVPKVPVKARMAVLAISSTLSGDIDNYMKAILDVMVKSSVMEDDRNLDSIFVSRAKLPSNIFFKLTLWDGMDEEERSAFARSLMCEESHQGPLV